MEILKKEVIRGIISDNASEIAKAIVEDAKGRSASGFTRAEINLETGKWYVYWEEKNTYSLDDTPTYTIYSWETPEDDEYCDENVLWDDVFPMIDEYMEENNVGYEEARDKVLEMEGTSYQEHLEITMEYYADKIYEIIPRVDDLDDYYSCLEYNTIQAGEEMNYIEKATL